MWNRSDAGFQDRAVELVVGVLENVEGVVPKASAGGTPKKNRIVMDYNIVATARSLPSQRLLILLMYKK